MRKAAPVRAHRPVKNVKGTPELPLDFYKVIVEHMTEGLWVGDKKHHTIYVNPAFERIFGYQKEEWRKMHSFDFFDEKNAQLIHEENSKRTKGAATKYEVEVLAKRGKNIPVLMSGAPTPDGGTVGIMADLRQLKETEERYKQLIETMNEGVWVCDAYGRTVYANPAFLNMIGCTLEDVLGKKEEIFIAQESQRIIAEDKKTRKKYEKSHYETLFVSKHNGKVPALVHTVPFDEGRLSTITDLRDVKRLEKSEREFQALAKYAMDAMISLDTNCIVRAWNVGAERMFGWTAEEMLGQPIDRIVPQEKMAANEVDDLRKEADEKGFVRNYETLRLHKNGKPIEVALTCSAIRDERGYQLGYSAIYRDVTMQKQWERELQSRFEKMQGAYMEMGKLRRYVDYLVDLLDLGTGVWEGSNLSQFIVNALLMFSKADAVVLRVLGPEKKRLHLKAAAGAVHEWHAKGSISLEGSLAEQAFAKKRPLKFLDVTQEPRYKTPGLARKNNLRSLLLLPLFVHSENIGTISVYISSENRLEVLDHEFIPHFAKQAALVLQLSSATKIPQK